MCEERNDCNCIGEILKRILLLQRKDYDDECFAGCDKPYLGPVPSIICYNTRPIQLYNCSTGTPWTFGFTSTESPTGSTDILRVESLDDCCCTCRLLSRDEATGTITGTSEFVTIDLRCCGAIRCLADTSIDLC